jgi:hypothetical protein
MAATLGLFPIIAAAQQLYYKQTAAQCNARGGRIITWTNTAGQGPDVGECFVPGGLGAATTRPALPGSGAVDLGATLDAAEQLMTGLGSLDASSGPPATAAPSEDAPPALARGRRLLAMADMSRNPCDAATLYKAATRLFQAADDAADARNASDLAAEAGSTCARTLAPSSGPGAQPCQKEVRLNVDWVFADRGAVNRYRFERQNGLSPFNAVLAAQAHNPPVQRLLLRCRGWVEGYLNARGERAGPDTLGEGRLGPQDCSCISVLPTGTPSADGGPGYRVVNSCGAMRIAVGFIGDITAVSPTYGLSSRADAGILATGEERVVYAPAWSLVSIRSVNMRNSTSSYTCIF